jgi:hypothetical protein
VTLVTCHGYDTFGEVYRQRVSAGAVLVSIERDYAGPDAAGVEHDSGWRLQLD